jgi:hypothetical protein
MIAHEVQQRLVALGFSDCDFGVKAQEALGTGMSA